MRLSVSYERFELGYITYRIHRWRMKLGRRVRVYRFGNDDLNAMVDRRCVNGFHFINDDDNDDDDRMIGALRKTNLFRYRSAVREPLDPSVGLEKITSDLIAALSPENNA